MGEEAPKTFNSFTAFSIRSVFSSKLPPHLANNYILHFSNSLLYICLYGTTLSDDILIVCASSLTVA